jgi:hypothetical protein
MNQTLLIAKGLGRKKKNRQEQIFEWKRVRGRDPKVPQSAFLQMLLPLLPKTIQTFGNLNFFSLNLSTFAK